MEHTSGFMNLISDLQNKVNEKDVLTVKNILDSNANIVLVDVRETEEWDEGYIPGALHICKGIIERDIEKIIPNKNTEVILYCRGGYRSMIAAESIQKMGYSKVISMTGGITAWQQAGFELTED